MQLTEQVGITFPDPDFLFEGQMLQCWHTPSKNRFPCVVLRVEWNGKDGDYILISSAVHALHVSPHIVLAWLLLFAIYV